VRIIDYFDKGAELAPDRTAIVAGEQVIGYREAQARTWAIAAGLWARGFALGHKVAVFSGNDAQAFLCMLGLWRAGGVWVPANVRNSLQSNIDYLNFVGAEWLIFHSDYAASVPPLRAAVPSLRHFVCLDRELPDSQSLDGLIAGGSGTTVPDWADPYGNPDQVAVLWPTGGTTGRSKAVMMTNLAWGTLTEIAGRYWSCPDLPPVCLMVAPITHAAGGIAVLVTQFGATNVILRGFEPLEVMQAIERHRVTHLFLPPTAFYALLAHPRVREFDYSSLRYFMVGAAPVAAEKLREGVEVFGPCLCQSFGQAESPVILTWQDPATMAAAAAGDHPERLKSCGRATYPVRVAVMAEDGRLLPPGEPGEIVARGTLVTPGYYQNQEATAEIRSFAWHHTGDVGFMDEHGFFYIVDRKKDMIVTGGYNVFSAEVEGTVLELPAVRECAVIGVPDEKWGEAVKALIVLRPGQTVAAGDVIAHCRQRLGGVKAPKSVEFRTELPKTAAGKLDKKELRRAYWAGRERAVN